MKTDYNEIHKETVNKLRSITPKTYKGNKFIDDDYYVDEYQYKTSKTSQVLHFGINTYRKELKDELVKYNLGLQIILQKALDDKIETKSNISNISGSTKYKPFCEKYIELTAYEKVVMKKAIDYMFDDNRKTCMVDIFPREFNDKNTGVGTINTKVLDVHTVVLYRAEDRILVVDPNNPMFSSHLNKYKDFKIETLCDTNLQYKIYSRPEGKPTGLAKDKWRDCIDIAVKISFALNNSGNTYKDLSELMSSQVIKLITNNPIIDEISLNDQLPVRLKQVSNLEKVIKYNMKLNIYSESLREKEKDALKFKQEAEKKIQIEYTSSVDLYNEEYKIKLLGLEDEYVKYLDESI